MPFGFLKRRKPDASGRRSARGRRRRAAPRDAAPGAGAGRAVHGAHGGLASPRQDADQRAAVRRAQSPGGDRHHGCQLGIPAADAALDEAPGLKSVDPYDLILITAGDPSLPPLTDTERAALKVHKVPYDVALEAPPFRVVGTVFLFPGVEPDSLLSRSTDMFLPVVDAVARLGDSVVSDPEIEVILVNRFYIRGVTQVDKRTGEAH